MVQELLSMAEQHREDGQVAALVLSVPPQHDDASVLQESLQHGSGDLELFLFQLLGS